MNTKDKDTLTKFEQICRLNQLIKEKLMQRKIEQWKNCVPDAMVHMSTAAIRYAFEDAKSDILSLWEDNQRLKAKIQEAYDEGKQDGFEAGFDECRDSM